MSIGHIIGLLKSSTALSSGSILVFEQRAYTIVGSPSRGISVSEQRAYIPVGSHKNSLSVQSQRTHVILGMPQSGQLAVFEQRAYAIIYP